MANINQKVLMSGADYFGDYNAINALMDSNVPVDVERAEAEHASIKKALEDAGVQVVTVAAPESCQDGVYTANWGLVRNGKILMSRLPNTRHPEEAYALQVAKEQGLETLVLPDQVKRFSGQGDALPCGDVVFTQSPFRTTEDAHPYIKEMLGYREVIALATKPARGRLGLPVKNKITGLPDSPTYDIDLAIAILKGPAEGQKPLIAYCPAVFKRSSRRLLASLDWCDKIKVSRKEALQAFALNLVSTGETVIMNSGAPKLQADIEANGLKTIPLELSELRKGGGSVRCSTLTLEN